KLFCLEALNNTTDPIYFAGSTHHIRKNDALAVLGDASHDCITIYALDGGTRTLSTTRNH
ncbi:hypothetical protein EK21DRAFT_72216, partial [Setomelanomma holmii]